MCNVSLGKCPLSALSLPRSDNECILCFIVLPLFRQAEIFSLSYLLACYKLPTTAPIPTWGYRENYEINLHHFSLLWDLLSPGGWKQFLFLFVKVLLSSMCYGCPRIGNLSSVKSKEVHTVKTLLIQTALHCTGNM